VTSNVSSQSPVTPVLLRRRAFGEEHFKEKDPGNNEGWTALTRVVILD
jgi:hypothetical protein